MSLVTPERKLIFFESTQFRSAVSEDMVQRQGAISNQNALYQYDVLEYKLNGPYSQVAVLPVTGLDGLYVFPFKMQIINVCIFNEVAGTSGTTEIDIKKATTGGGAFTSIFSTTPKIASTASNEAFALSYNITLGTSDQIWTANPTPPTGVTPGVLNGGAPYTMNAGEALRVDLISVMANASNCGVTVYFRPMTQ
ncbi:MAG: hypothetical protein E6Q97_34025 [Desulfurellales bacterium]|nr:MAG: hypothetical protein E6Q97_34025 [Desulfurellales bacterium]